MASNKKPSVSSLFKANTIQIPTQIKREPLPADSKLYTSERLSSFRLPRDLTLGGVPLKAPVARPNLLQTNKRVYTPNLNAIRNKNVDVKTSRDTSNSYVRGRGRGRGGVGVERGRGGGTRTNTPRNEISSSGVFSEGAGDGATKRLFRSFRGADETTASILRRPTLSKKREKFDPQAEKKHIAEIYDLDVDDIDDPSGGSAKAAEEPLINDQYSPIILSQIKNEVKLEERINGMDIKQENNDSSNTRLKYPRNIGEFLDRNTPQLFLMQLPDALPGHGTEPEPADSAENQDSSQLQDNLCTMRNLEEGQIGRLVRYRSGKTKLLLGDSKFDINLGIDPNLLQEVVSTQINKSERRGSVINLGKINAKLSAVPDWEFILDNIIDKKS